MRVEELAKLIRNLSLSDTARLAHLLGWDTPPPISTREPRRPRIPSLHGGVALEEPPDKEAA